MGLYEDTATGLFEAVAIKKGEIEMVEKTGMPAKTLVAKREYDNFEAAREIGKVEGIIEGQLSIIELLIEKKTITIAQVAEVLDVSVPKMKKILEKRKETNKTEACLEIIKRKKIHEFRINNIERMILQKLSKKEILEVGFEDEEYTEAAIKLKKEIIENIDWEEEV